MEIILTQDVQKVGKAGSVIKVRDGFARNFLLPRRLAVPATPVNLKKIEQEEKRVARVRELEKTKALDLSNRLNSVSITIPMGVHGEDKLYGSVTSLDIAEALKQEGILEVDKDSVLLDEPIKTIGVYDVTIRLHPEVSSQIKVWVVKK